MKITRQSLRRIIQEAVADVSYEKDIHVFTNDLDPTMSVVVIYPENPRYPDVAPLFDQKGHGFLANDRLMVIDGAALGQAWFTEDHLTVMQAHELGHKLAGHLKGAQQDHRDAKIEKEADWLGYKILRHRNLNDAADLHLDEYEARYASLPDKDDYLMVHLSNYVT
mgnify:FL=1